MLSFIVIGHYLIILFIFSFRSLGSPEPTADTQARAAAASKDKHDKIAIGMRGIFPVEKFSRNNNEDVEDSLDATRGVLQRPGRKSIALIPNVCC